MSHFTFDLALPALIYINQSYIAVSSMDLCLLPLVIVDLMCSLKQHVRLKCGK